MAGRLAIDFGTCNTVVAIWDVANRQGVPLNLPGYAKLEQQGDEQIAVLPSLIHYGEGGKKKIANQVFTGNVYHSERTFRWMKRYIMRRSPAKQRIDGRNLSHFDAGQDYLVHILQRLAQPVRISGEEIAVTVPVESFEHYENWLCQVLESLRLTRYRIIDEPSAAALGYGVRIQPGDVHLVFDFGCGTLDVSVIMIEPDAEGQAKCRCRILGKAGADIGGASIDQWLFAHVLEANKRPLDDEEARKMSRLMLVECERAKELLSFNQSAAVSVMNPYTGGVLEAEIARPQFEELLDKHELYAQVVQTIRRAINASRERGYDEDAVKAVLMVGGSSLIPSVQRSLHQFFGKDRVKLGRPLDAVARGAAAFVAGAQFVDYVQHDYAIRHVDRKTGQYDFRTIVRRGTPYPTKEPVDRFTIKATYDQQNQMGIAIFEMDSQEHQPQSGPVELVFDTAGMARLVTPTGDDLSARSQFWMNEHKPMFLHADPPAHQGEPRFNVEFGIDSNKRLLVTVQDAKTGKLLHKDYPVVKLN